ATSVTPVKLRSQWRGAPRSRTSKTRTHPFQGGQPRTRCGASWLYWPILMASIALPHGRLIRQIWVALVRNLTSWVAVGTIVAETGFGPEHWFAAAFRGMPQAWPVWPSWLDIRAVIVSIGVAIVVADVLVRRRHREKTASGPAASEAPLPQSEDMTRAL